MNKQTLKNFGLSLVLAIFLALSSQITVPLLFVPITCQTLAIGLIATMFGLNISLESISLYILMGAFGLPVFAGAHSGIAVIFGTTGGYIWGFLIYAFLVKFMLHNSKATLKISVANLTAATLQLFIGAAWLMFVAHLTPQAAIANGVLPFLVPGAIKIVAIVAVARLFAQRVPVLYR